MSGEHGLETTFNAVAEQYDRMRPGYVRALYRDIFRYGQITAQSSALEIGIGTGQATGPVLEKGCSVVAVELGDRLAAYSSEKFAQYSNFTVYNTDFLDFDAPNNSFDLIYSASAFHWIPEEAGYKRVFDLLAPGGVFARFANHPYRDKEKPALHDAMQRWYGLYMPGSKPADAEYSEDQARVRAEIAGLDKRLKM